MDQSLKATEAWVKLLECSSLREVMAMLVDDLAVQLDSTKSEGREDAASEIVAARELIAMAMKRLPSGL